MTAADLPLLIGSSPAAIALRRDVELLARSTVPVLTIGERGVGKAGVARIIHALSARRDREFVTGDCAGLAEPLVDAELFGLPACTTRPRRRPGKIEMAHEGTLFLDEVADLPYRLQGLLLEALERAPTSPDRDRAAPLDIRLIAATSRNIAELASQGRIRDDLYRRLLDGRVTIPPLRERLADVPELADHILRRLRAGSEAWRERRIDREALQVLAEYRWPGNVRELEAVVTRMAANSDAEVLTTVDLPPEVLGAVNPTVRQHQERRRTIADELYQRLVEDHESFWSLVYPLYMRREIARGSVRDLVRRGLQDARGNYKIVTRLFNIDPRDYKRFLNFLRKHDCQLPFKEFR